MTTLQILILAAIQGAAELLPVSSSAHVIVAEKLMGLNPSSPEMTFLLVMLHTGTMFAVLVYFWNRWRKLIHQGSSFIRAVITATAVTGVVGLGLKVVIEKVILEKFLGHSKGEVETLFQYLPLLSLNLVFIGALIIYAGKKSVLSLPQYSLKTSDSVSIGLVQAICLPLRGFSRSGATISTALLRSLPRALSEDFSFALAVVLTPPVILMELRRLLKASADHAALDKTALLALMQPGFIGMIFSFVAGLLALKWLSRWLESGKWHYFGYYCLVAACFVMGVHFALLNTVGNTVTNG
jgi:undecaprenyl-diphosphatase